MDNSSTTLTALRQGRVGGRIIMAGDKFDVSVLDKDKLEQLYEVGVFARPEEVVEEANDENPDGSEPQDGAFIPTAEVTQETTRRPSRKPR